MANGNTPMQWERQEGETQKAWEAFCIYRDLGADRSIAKVGKKLGKSAALMERWSAKYEWVSRCAAWDAEQDRIARQEQLKEIKKMRKRHAALASSMLIKAASALQNLPPEEISASEISRMVDVASKLERISRGDVGEVIEERDGGKAVSPVQIYIPSNGRERGNDNFEDLEV